MPVSYSNVNPANLELTPMRVTFNGVDLGGTLGNVLVTPKYVKAPLMADQYGKTVLDRRVSAVEITVTTELAEVLNKDNWKVVFPHAKEVTSGTKLIQWVNAIGDSDLSHSAQLLLHPLSKADADLTENYLFYKACSSAESEITYSPEGQAKLKIVWNILPDTSVSPAVFFIYGDPAVGLVAATAGSPSFTGTGNGTMGSVVAYSGITKTETITATCVTAVANGGIFFVSGSLSGALGLATVGISFIPVSPDPAVISFTIADGSTDFVVGDQFTVATVAANYV